MGLVDTLERDTGGVAARTFAVSGEDSSMNTMKAQHSAMQADICFLRFILVGLALTTCFLGAATVMAMS